MKESLQNKKDKISERKILEYIKAKSSFEKTLFFDLGVTVVRVICYSELFLPHIQKQLTYILRDKADHYNATIYLWQEDNLREMLHQEGFIAADDSNEPNLLEITLEENVLYLCSDETKTYFFGAEDLDPEELVKKGHIFVQLFNKILKTPNTNLIHGACIGLNNHGILVCARGQKGKSTLTVLSLLDGFEYVSDDYLTLEKENNKLYAYPIYSIITLSPRMYNEMYDKLEGTRFISNNARKDKYVINIAKYHSHFKKKYPIDLCLVLEFTSDEEPSIVEASKQEKSNAVAQMVHSTVFQMHDFFETVTVKKLIDMISCYRFYKICLCNNIYKNVECLRKFLEEYKYN